MAGLKHSRQREAILDYLHSTKSHPTAEAVYWKVREEFPKSFFKCFDKRYSFAR